MKLKLLNVILFLALICSYGLCQNLGNRLSSIDSIVFLNPVLNNITYSLRHDTIVEKMPDDSMPTKTIKAFLNNINTKTEVFYPTGQKKSVGFYNVADNKLFEIGYYENGKLHYISYIDTISPILTLEWNILGQIILFIDNRAGCSIKWYDDGNIEETVNNVKDEEDEELIINYYKNGQLKNKVITNSGIQEYNHYYDTGSLKHHGYYLNSTLNRIGKWIEYYEDGKIKREYNFSLETPELKIGQWFWWDESGHLIKSETYKNGNLISP